jgi:hypothetical protein
MKTSNSIGACVLLTLPLFLFAAGRAPAQCRPGDTLVGEDAENYYCMSRYEGSEAQQYGRQFCQARLALAADQTAIRSLGFATAAERFELYAGVASEQKTQLQHRILGALFDQGLSATQTVVNSASSLNPWNVNRAATMLETNRFGNSSVIAALRRIARQRDKPAMAAAYRDFAQAVRGAKEGWETSSDMSTDAKNSRLRLAMGTLKIVQGNPELGLVISSLEFGESLAYLWYLTGEVADLAKASDETLGRLPALSKRLQDRVDTLTRAKRAWQTSTGYTMGTPTCR